MNKIGGKIKDTRKRVGMTQTEVAEKMGVSYQTVAQWENGLRNPKPESVKRIADALGVGYLDLIPEDSEWAYLFDAATALSTLRAENEKLRAELEKDQKFNGRYAVVYFDPKKWSSPLIDICGTPYNREEAEERMKALKAELRRGRMDKNCGTCNWYNDGTCLNDQSSIYKTGEHNTCPHWETYVEGMWGEV